MSPQAITASDARANARAIWTICAGVLCLCANDAMAKTLTMHYAPLQIVFIRHLLALPMIGVAAVLLRGPAVLRTRHLGTHAVRGLLLVGGAWTFFLGISFLPLAEATSLVFSAPIFITALSVPLLREHVGWRRWAAVAVGFAGVLIVVRPGTAAFQPASLVVMLTALIYALIMIGARWIDRREDIWTMMFYVVLFPLLFSALAQPFLWRPPQPGHLPLFLGMAVLGTLGLTLITQAFRMAPAAIVAPFDYTALIWASLFGWLFWGEVPALWTYAGAAVIIASGIYIVLRETRADPG